MATNYATSQGYITERNKLYYRTRTLGGVGLIVLECANIDPANRHRMKCITIADDKFIPGLLELTKVIHEGAVPVVIQIGHPGRLAASKVTGSRPIAPSAVPNPAGEVPRVMTIEDIERVQDLFVKAAVRAKAAGFDGVEIHGSHGYLITQFVSPYSNKRTDQYGGTLANRMRFPLEIVSKVRAATGPDFLVFFRMSATEFRPAGEGFNLEEAVPYAVALEKAGVDVLDISAGTNETLETMAKVIPMRNTPPGCFTDLSAAIKKAVTIPVITVGRIDTPEVAEKILTEGQADLVALGRALLADAYWPLKAKEGRSAEITKCIACNKGCLGELNKHENLVCVVNPLLGLENEIVSQ